MPLCVARTARQELAATSSARTCEAVLVSSSFINALLHPDDNPELATLVVCC